MADFCRFGQDHGNRDAADRLRVLLCLDDDLPSHPDPGDPTLFVDQRQYVCHLTPDQHFAGVAGIDYGCGTADRDSHAGAASAGSGGWNEPGDLRNRPDGKYGDRPHHPAGRRRSFCGLYGGEVHDGKVHKVDAAIVACDADRPSPDDLCSLDYDGIAELAHALSRASISPHQFREIKFYLGASVSSLESRCSGFFL